MQTTQIAADHGVRFLLADKSLGDLCGEYVRAGPYFINGKLTSKNPRHLLGWLHSPMNNYRRLKSVAQLREHMSGVLVAMDPSIRRKRLRAEAEPDPAVRDIDNIAKSLKLRSSEVRQLVIACGDTIANLNADVISGVTSKICSQEAAAEVLGVDGRRFAALRKARLVKPLLRGFAGNPAKYDGEAIRCLIENLSVRTPTDGTHQQNLTLEQYQRVAQCSYATAVRRVLSGELPISGWDPTKRGLTAIFVLRPKIHRMRRTTLDVGHVTAGQAAARLCVQPDVVKNLVRLRVVAGKVKSGKAWSVNVQSLDKFAREFTPAKLFAEQLQCPLCKLPAKLQSLGVPIVFSTRQVGVTIVRRSDIARILPALRQGNDFAASFFSEMRARFLTSNYGHCLRWFEGESEATILGIGGRVRLLMTYQSQQPDTVATLLISSSVSEKMLALADETFQVLWRKSSIRARSGGRATISQSYPLEGLAGSQERTFDWLERCALSLRSVVAHPCKRQPACEPHAHSGSVSI
ncbi:hypothetical protein [Mesorhizobium sp. B4-1-1]|uniref:hypothetical protein n=1 Tax=Mesorhizobium sp. B4-1-1 TaxID=2589890 RepID=UPI001FEEFD2C|nr:hypothetical protein [Mesorhizobium sp. B4-1-1]